MEAGLTALCGQVERGRLSRPFCVFWLDPLKAAVVACVIAVAIKTTIVAVHFRGGIAVLFFTLAVWAEAIPAPAVWGKMAHSAIAELCS